MIHPCGCVNEVHGLSGILHSVRKCPRHAAKSRDPAMLDGRYYEELGVIKDGKLLPTKHVEELAEALGLFPEADDNGIALEIGCGASPYVSAIRAQWWTYMGMDLAPWAGQWIRDYWGAPCLVGDWETVQLHGGFGLILCAHALEHMRDAPAALAKMATCLQPGGELWIVVPDDSDPSNPDHFWMFTEATLRSAVEAAGLVVERTAVRKYIERENFLYARARRAG
jgi:SAM-dependent methyltransferase